MRTTICFAMLLLAAPASRAELITLPAPPMTVADCGPTQHWDRRPTTGIAYCAENIPPPPPPAPPADQWSYAYRLWAFLGNTMNGVTCYVRLERFTNGPLPDQATLMLGSVNGPTSSGSCDPGLLTAPWGFDYLNYLTSGSSAMRPPAQFLIDRGCMVLSEDASIQGRLNAITGANVGAGITGAGYQNWGLCPSPISP
ncbi:hypothetical protein SAMN05216345_101893 [Cupriavidus sp. YR651]|nr:hypothetical protein SAMN05216345_101893 [Cupriavidus sp. YR651]